MIIDNLKQELIDNYVQNADKVMDLFAHLGSEPYNCISPNNPENKKIIVHSTYSDLQTTAGKNIINLSLGKIIYNNKIIPAIIQECENELTYYFK